MAPSDKTPTSAWDKDKEFGNILSQTLSPEDEGTTFLLIAGIVDGKQETKFGNVDKATMLIRRLADDGVTPVGPAFEVSTVESAIVAKIDLLTAEDVPAIVRYHTIASKNRGGGPAKVLSFVSGPGSSNEAELLKKYGVEGGAVTDSMAGF